MAPAGETIACILTVPLNWLRLVNVITDEFDEPDWTVSETWLEASEKSGATVTVIRTTTEWSRTPFVPVKVVL